MRSADARAVAFALLLAIAACGRGQTSRAAGVHDGPPPAPDPALLARIGALENQAIDSLPPGHGKEMLLRACTTCHSATMIAQQRKPAAEWAKTVDKMVSWGAPLDSAEARGLVDYLAAIHPTS